MAPSGSNISKGFLVAIALKGSKILRHDLCFQSNHTFLETAAQDKILYNKKVPSCVVMKALIYCAIPVQWLVPRRANSVLVSLELLPFR